MKKTYIFILLLLITTFMNAQRGVKIGYIDTEYILENLQEYKQAQKKKA